MPRHRINQRMRNHNGPFSLGNMTNMLCLLQTYVILKYTNPVNGILTFAESKVWAKELSATESCAENVQEPVQNLNQPSGRGLNKRLESFPIHQ